MPGPEAAQSYPKTEHVANSSEYAMGAKKVQKPKSRALDQYLDPEDLQDPSETVKYAISRERVLMNYPFFGELLKKKGGHFRLKETISKSRPVTLEDVEGLYGAGEYQIRLTLADDEKVIPFTIESEAKPTQNTTSQPIKSHSDAEYQMLQENLVQANMKIKKLEQRIDDRDQDLDDYQRKVRKLNEELIEVERRGQKRYADKIENLERKVEQLKDEKTELDRKNFELQFDLDHSDSEGGFDIMKVLEKATENETVQNIIKAFAAQRVGAPIHQLNGPRPNPGNNSEQPLHDAETQNEESMNQAQTQVHPVTMVVRAIFQRAAQTLVDENPDYDQAIGFVNEQIEALQSQGMNLEAKHWINIAKELVKFSVQHGIENERLANVVQPLLENMDMARNALKNSPVKMVLPVLKSTFDLSLQPNEEQVLVEVLNIFKARLNES